jgi:ABC-type nitrate/sulfonate/bicarbonate transport system permease component
VSAAATAAASVAVPPGRRALRGAVLPLLLLTAWQAANSTGLSIGVAAGLAVGTLLGLSKVADRLLSPSFDALKQIAIFAWIPLISMWFGIGETARVVSWPWPPSRQSSSTPWRACGARRAS